MVMKSLLIKSAIAFTVLSCSVQANDSFKLAIIEGTPAAGHILKGDYQQSMTYLAKQQAKDRLEHNVAQRTLSVSDSFETAMSHCVVHIKVNQLEKAQFWCDKAVTLVESAPQYRTTVAKFKALALNNRAIVKYLQNDNLGAYQDFKQALSLHQSRMVKSNQWQFSELYMASNLTSK